MIYVFEILKIVLVPIHTHVFEEFLQQSQMKI